MENEQSLKKELEGDLRLNEPLSGYNRLGVGGVADYFYIAKTIDDLVKAITCACRLNIPYFIIGGGNNVIPSDSGFSGLVIKNNSSNIVFNSGCSEVIVDSGVSIATLINSAAGRNLGGLEFLAGMEGTIGGAMKNSYGDNAFTINDFVKSVTLAVKRGNELVLTNLPALKLNLASKSFDIKGIEIDYPPVILTVRMQLVHRRKDEILNLITDNWQRRKSKIKVDGRVLVDYFKESSGSGSDINQLLDAVNARKIKFGDATILKRYPNSIVNNKNASATDVRKLAETLRDLIQKKVWVMFRRQNRIFW